MSRNLGIMAGWTVIESRYLPKDTALLVNASALRRPVRRRGDAAKLDCRPWAEREAARIFNDLRGVLFCACPISAPPEWERYRKPLSPIMIRALYGGAFL